MMKTTTFFSGMVMRERNEAKINLRGLETVFPAREKFLKVKCGLRVKMKSKVQC